MLLSITLMLLCAGALLVFLWPNVSRRMRRLLKRSDRMRRILSGSFASLFALNALAVVWQVVGHHELDGFTQAASVVTVFALVVLLMFALLARLHLERPVDVPHKVLVVGAHPDDLELACGGTIARLVDGGHFVHGIVMTHGTNGGDREVRLQEALDGAAFLGMHNVEVHDLPDTRLETVNSEMIAIVEKAIREVEPNLILTHSAHDQHQDHQAVHLAVLRAGRHHSNILGFESPSSTREFNPSIFIDISEYVDIKIEAIQLHRNQSGKPYMTPERTKGIASFRGGQAKCVYAEAYEPVRYLIDSGPIEVPTAGGSQR